MKVLFAVSNEEISESIVKKYQKQYKEIISYKNVYYFNAILKELQKDKTYDRVVISEELEAFTNTQYDQIDKFIFEKLDSISDEASDMRGNDIPIILICSDRRTRPEALLVKLFGIGVYNALIGNDRSIDEVCNLISKPRSKKEAKTYYKIESDEVNYQAENENDVSEMEIQNIVAHYKRLGKNEEKYIESFDNIAAQYNDNQLRIITKFLPLNVRAVLEERSPKYQQVMSFNNTVSDSLRYQGKSEESSGPSETLLKPKTRENIINEPIVIPSSVNANGSRKLSRVKKVAQPQNINLNNNINNPTVNNNQTMTNMNMNRPTPDSQQVNDTLSDINVNTNSNNNNNINQNSNQTNEIDLLQSLESLTNNETVQQGYNYQEPQERKEQNDEPIVNVEEPVVPVKRGRGRPRKNPVPEQNDEPKVKRGRGRPRKNPVPEVEEPTIEESTILPGFDDQEVQEPILPGINQEPQEQILPGIGQTQENNDFLPGFDSEENNNYDQVQNQRETSNDFLPGFYDEPKQEKDNNIQQTNIEQQREEFLSGFGEVNNQNYNEPQQYSNQNTQYEPVQYNEPNTQYEPQPQQYQPTQEFNNYDENNNNYNNYNSNIDTSYENTADLSSLLTPDKKIVTFVGTSKNGTSFIVNNIAEYMSTVMGVNTAVLDTTKNRNSYYIYTKNEEQLRNVATHSIEGLAQGVAQGISANKNLTVYTSLPDENQSIRNVDTILETLLKNHSLILIDTDFETPLGYFKQTQETYLVQTLDVLTIQPLTAFLRDLKAKNILDETKLRIILNKTVRIRGINEKTIIGGMAYYNDPSMSFMTELFDRTLIKYVSIPFEEEIYAKYLQEIIECEISLKGYSKEFMQTLKQLASMVYSNNNSYTPPSMGRNEGNNFSSNMNSTLEQMRRNY